MIGSAPGARLVRAAGRTEQRADWTRREIAGASDRKAEPAGDASAEADCRQCSDSLHAARTARKPEATRRTRHVTLRVAVLVVVAAVASAPPSRARRRTALAAGRAADAARVAAAAARGGAEDVLHAARLPRRARRQRAARPGTGRASTGIPSGGSGWSRCPASWPTSPARTSTSRSAASSCSKIPIADGRMDKRTVFADGLVLARSIKVLDRGVLVAEPPNVWLMRDTTAICRRIRRTLVTDRYGRRDVDPQNNANGFDWALDNRMYTAGQADIQLRLKDGRFEATRTLQRGEWGVTQDDAGRIYRNTNESALHVDLVPTHYYARNPSLLRTRGSYERLATGNEDLNIVWPVRPNPGTNRAYQAGIDRPDGTLVQVHLGLRAAGLSRRSSAGGALRQRVRGRTGRQPRGAARARGRQRRPDRAEGLPARRVPGVHRRALPAGLPLQRARRHAVHRRPVPRHHRAPHLDHRVPARSDSRAPPRSRHRLGRIYRVVHETTRARRRRAAREAPRPPSS